MWLRCFSGVSDELLKEFNASLNVDKTLFNEDIQGSIVHATMLESCGILKKEELDAITKGLEQVRSEIEQGKFIFDIKDEDIHMAMEKRLSEIIGSEIARRIHTARSRNNQVSTDFKLFVKKSHIEFIKLLKELIQTILEHAKVHKKLLCEVLHIYNMPSL